ncbi:MAG: DUF4149 domain-containing protein [Bryobacteraceae bacterium]|nr:DUF4149 domain-containing protein [Bryobacteraceae bacterium]
MSSSHRPAARRKSQSSFGGERISSTVSRRSRRLAVFLLGLWMGGIVAISIAAPASFRSVEKVMAERPEIVTAATDKLGPVTMRDILRYQVAETNRMMFTIWGWVQCFLSLALLLLLIFLSNAGRLSLLCSGLMAAVAALANFVLIPRIVELARTNIKGVGSAERFELMHSGFTTFQATILVLGLVLLFSLFRRRERTGGGSRAF